MSNLVKWHAQWNELPFPWQGGTRLQLTELIWDDHLDHPSEIRWTCPITDAEGHGWETAFDDRSWIFEIRHPRLVVGDRRPCYAYDADHPYPPEWHRPGILAVTASRSAIIGNGVARIVARRGRRGSPFSVSPASDRAKILIEADWRSTETSPNGLARTFGLIGTLPWKLIR